MFLQRVEATPDGEAFRYPSDGGWARLTWAQVGQKVRALAAGLRALGLKPEERVAILSGTRIEWILADLAILCGGGATTTIYPSSTPEDIAYILADSESVLCFAETADHVRRIVERRGELPNLRHVVTFDGQASEDGFVLTLAELEARGREEDARDPEAFARVARAVTGSSLATLIYTSGTTGRPKGVELTHDCWVYEAEAIDAMQLLRPDDVQYLWLPLAHSFGKVLEAAQIKIGFVTAVDGRIDKLVDNLAVVKPTFVAAVPRIFEKVQNKVVMGVRAEGGLKEKIFDWAFGVGREVSRLRQQGREPSGLLALKYRLATKLVFSKLQDRFGGRLRFFVSGSAPLSRPVAEFFHAAGILILEGYGLTETSAASFVNRPHAYKFGTVGQPLPGTQVRIDPSDGEILIKSRGVMRGYKGLPEATAEALDAEGWLHTGDIGELDAEGFLRITDRKKDLIKTSGGKYVAPQNLEGRLKALCPYVSQVLVHGNNRNFCSALITLDPEAIGRWAAEHGRGGASYEDLTRDPEVRALIQGCVDQLNATLASYETIKKFALLPADLSLEAGELTPSLKVKRKAVEAKYRALLDEFYTGTGKD
jgi:long-chain acyl-CoA synthetase